MVLCGLASSLLGVDLKGIGRYSGRSQLGLMICFLCVCGLGNLSVSEERNLLSSATYCWVLTLKCRLAPGGRAGTSLQSARIGNIQERPEQNQERMSSACAYVSYSVARPCMFLVNLTGYTDFSAAFLPWLLEGVHVLRDFTAISKVVLGSGGCGECICSLQDSSGSLSLCNTLSVLALSGNHTLRLCGSLTLWSAWEG